MAGGKKRVWDPTMHDYLEDQDGPTDEGQEDCPNGGKHDPEEIDRSAIGPDGDPAWTKCRCKKCGKIETVH